MRFVEATLSTYQNYIRTILEAVCAATASQ